ncbi:hypothetical protein LTR17_009878 [Elasticomyces elasticus]|nr:hypothetical protein LTR17_009878 [Elasticomyces elasticus]
MSSAKCSAAAAFANGFPEVAAVTRSRDAPYQSTKRWNAVGGAPQGIRGLTLKNHSPTEDSSQLRETPSSSPTRDGVAPSLSHNTAELVRVDPNLDGEVSDEVETDNLLPKLEYSQQRDAFVARVKEKIQVADSVALDSDAPS